METPEVLKEQTVKQFLSLYEIDPIKDVKDVTDTLKFIVDAVYQEGYKAAPIFCEQCGTTEFLCGHNKKQ